MNTKLSVPIIVLFFAISPFSADRAESQGIADTTAAIQSILSSVATGSSADLRFDMNGDQKVDLRDAVLYGQWVNGLFCSSAHPVQTLTVPADTAAWQQYGANVKSRKPSWTPQTIGTQYPFMPHPLSKPYDSVQVDFLSRLLDNAAYQDTAYRTRIQAQLLQKGSAICGRRTFPSLASAVDAIHSADLPLLVTTDAILESMFRSYDNILVDLETVRFAPQLDHILLSSLGYCREVYPDSACVGYVRDLLTTALLLLNPSRTDVAPSSNVSAWLAAIGRQSMESVTLFDTTVLVDFSQFKPRGHYTRTTQLSNYFKAMMWLSRADIAFRISGDGSKTSFKKAAVVLWDCVVNSGSYAQWLQLDDIIGFMVGQSDGMSVKQMGSLAHRLGVLDGRKALDSMSMQRFDSVLALTPFGMQTILSTCTPFPGGTDSIAFPRIFNFMPQRFALDSYTFSQLVYPYIDYRALPSSLDIAFALGDNSALAEDSGVGINGVPGVLASQRDLYDQLSAASWSGTLYGSWLNCLRALNGAEANDKLSGAFRTAEWRLKMRNTQLTSWAQLRHNTILYVKQSYTGMVTCDHPSAYVEPYPNFFAAVAAYTQRAAALFKPVDQTVSNYFAGATPIVQRLEAIALAETRGQQPSQADIDWMKTMVTTLSPPGCMSGKVLNGWYFDLLYQGSTFSPVAPQIYDSYATIADVHTKPADDVGPALVFHAATGLANWVAVVVDLDSCSQVFVGPVGSYYDVTTSSPSPLRYSDDDWNTILRSGGDSTFVPAWRKSITVK